MFSPRPVAPISLLPATSLQHADAARAMDAAGHVGSNQGAEILVPDHPFLFAEARHPTAVFQRHVP